MDFSTEWGDPNSSISLLLDAPSGRERHSTLGDSGWRSCHREATWSWRALPAGARSTPVLCCSPPAHMKWHMFISVGLASVWQSATDTRFLSKFHCLPLLCQSCQPQSAFRPLYCWKLWLESQGKVAPLVSIVPGVMMCAVTWEETRYVTGKMILTTCPLMLTRHHN